MVSVRQGGGMKTPIFTNKEKSAAFEWLKEYALVYDDNEHAACIVVELVELNKRIKELKKEIYDTTSRKSELSNEEKINIIVSSIYNREQALSDGFGFYSGKDTDKVLEEIAEEILKVIS